MAVITIDATKDATARENDDGWSGYDEHLPVGTSPAGFKYASYIYFPISFVGMESITNAKLWVRGHRPGSGYHVLGATSGSRTLSVRRMMADWGEGTNRGEGVWSAAEPWGWENRRSGSEQIIGGGSRAFTTYVHGTWYDIDVTQAVQVWQLGEPNYGLMLAFASGAEETDQNDALEFYSRQAGSGYKPYLEITYTTNTLPGAPTGLSPTGNALVNSLTPNLSGSMNDVDGDYIAMYNIQVYADDGTTLLWDQSSTLPRANYTFSRTYGGPALSGNTFYRWRARLSDQEGYGAWSSQQRFKVNTAPNPPTVAITETPLLDLTTLTPTLNVTHSDNDVGDSKMYGYRVQLDTYPEGVSIWDSGDVDTSASPATTKSLPYSGPALAWQTYYRVRARTKDINGVWGPYSAYTIMKTHKSATPTSLDPSGGETISGLVPTFTGNRGSVNDTITNYQILLYAANGTTLLWDSGSLNTGIITGSSFSKAYTGTALSYGTTYQWTARVFSTVGGWSSYPAYATFTTPTDASAPTQSISPVTNGRVTSLTPTLTGTRTSAFTNYQIELYAGDAVTGGVYTPIWDSGNLSQSSATSVNKVYNGPALSWNTTYKWRIRVGAPGLGGYTGLSAFTTDTAGTPTLTAPANNTWSTNAAPTFTGSSFGGESITAVRIRLYDSTGSTLIWDSGDLAQTSATTFSKPYTGPTLAGGNTYLWEARYTKSTGPTGPYSTRFAYRVNGAPLIPTELFPEPGRAFTSLFPRFEAAFNDPDEATHADTPASWVIEIRNNATDAVIQTKTLTTGLSNALNTYTWGTNTGGTDTGLAYNVVYKWRTWFTDSKGATGTASSYQTFSNAQPPVAAFISPSNGSNITTTKPIVTWSYTDPASSAQMKMRLRIYRVLTDVLVYDSGERVSSAQTFTVPTGYFSRNGEEYRFDLQVWNSLNLPSTRVTSTVELQLAAPPKIQGLSATVYEDQSRVVLEWDASALSTAFVTYVIYRREVGETEWGMIGTRKPETSTVFSDWYAGQRKYYEYRVTVVKLINGEPDLESPDSDIVTVRLESDVWMVIGHDRADAHIFELPVTDESHSRPVQQEEFETLGTNRKVIVRGFVLGHEGSFELMYQPEESGAAREAIEYLLYYAGPHILKNPFGDVFDVTFGSPDYSYQGGGLMGVTLTWTETGATNNPTLTPEQYLAQIGAE